MSFVPQGALLALLAAIFHCAISSPVWMPQFLSGGSGRNIRHLPCVSRRTGETGVCMFAFACMKANGTHLGTCIDRFYFGSCCRLDEENVTIIPNTEDNNVIPVTTTTESKYYLSTFQSVQENDNKVGADITIKPVKQPTKKPSVIDKKPNPSPMTTSKQTTTTKHTTERMTTVTETTTTRPMKPSTESTTQTTTNEKITPSDSKLSNQSLTNVPVTEETTKLPYTSRPPESTTKTTEITSRIPITHKTTEKTQSQTKPINITTSQPTLQTKPFTTTKPKTTARPTGTTIKPIIQTKPTSTVTKKPITKPSATTTKRPQSQQKPTTTVTAATTTTKPTTQTKLPTATTVINTKRPTEVKPTSSTTRRPTLQTKPTTTTKKPLPLTKPPVTTTTTKKPVTQTKPPAVSTWTKPLDTSTKPTVSTTKKPETTTMKVVKTTTEFTTEASTPTSAPAALITWTMLQEPTRTEVTNKPTTTTPAGTTTDGWILIPVTTHPPAESNSESGISTFIPSDTTTPETVATTSIFMTTSSKPEITTIPPEITSVSEVDLNMTDFRQVCGRRLFPESRIVGGEKSSFGKWPWQISLRQWRTSTYLHKCGAALLNENWAITAAHCVENVPPSDLLLRLGEHDLSSEEEPYGYQERRVQIVASHPQFDPRTFEYDLALLRFYEPVIFQPNILPVCVPEDDTNFVGHTAYVTGWGRLYEDGPLPSVLQEVSVPVINNSVCETMYRSAGYIEHIPEIFICAGWRKGGFDSCEGDSGGPMVIQRPDKRWLLAGVISWGIGCAEPNQPGVYTRISEFREWINQILQF